MLDSISAYLGVVLIGLLHGLEPGHGWPVAVLYSMRKKNSLFSATVSSSLIGFAHLFSSLAVVIAFVLLRGWLKFDAPWLKYVSSGLLVVLAIRMFLEKPDALKEQHGHIHEGKPDVEHEHPHEHDRSGIHTHQHKHSVGVVLSLWGLATFAFILGFAHEEEFALLALVAGGVNAWVLMLAYGIAVLISLVIVTLTCVRLFKNLQPKLVRYEKYVPKIGAVILLVLAAVILFWG
ncbi:MAG: nickel/cobalt transporter [Dehalococcoidia bacterium]|nr:nickel/cobalt transporter [Dehalococcoidia bacterium]